LIPKFIEQGIHISEDDWRIWVAGSHTISSWVEEFALAVNYPQLMKTKLHEYGKLIDLVELKPGVEAALKSTERFLVGCASHSRKQWIDRVFSRFGIASYFQSIVTLSDVPKGKPAPDIYLKAASELGLEPKNCVAIEDSQTGLIAANAAGMTTVIIPDRKWDDGQNLSSPL
jgi:HAD superfamily hydrolase (TIGR01509 family)